MTEERLAKLEGRFEEYTRSIEHAFKAVEIRFMAVDKRVDDVGVSLNKRIDDMKSDLDHRMNTVETDIRELRKAIYGLYVLVVASILIPILLKLMFP